MSRFGDRPWLFAGLVIAFAASERLIFHVEARNEAVSYTPSEAALAVGLLFLDPVALVVARLAGSSVGMILWRRPTPFKLTVNLASFALETAIAATLFGLLGRGGDTFVTIWLAVMTSVVVALVAGGAVVAVVIAQFEGGLVRRVTAEVRNAHIFYVPSAAVAACIAVPATIDLQLGLVALIPAPIFWLLLRSHGTLIHRFADLASIHDFSRQIAGSSDLAELARTAAEQIANHTRAERVSLRLFKGDGSPVDATTGTPVGTNLFPSHPSDQRWRDVLGSCDVARNGPTIAPQMNERCGPGLDGALIATIGDDAGFVGFLVVADRRGASTRFDDDDLGRVRSMIQQLAVTVRKTQLHSQIQFEATHDRLSSLPNRSYFESWMAQAGPGHHSGATLLIDLNRFKQINDSFGHHAGDLVLVESGARIRNECGPDDLAARFGGDEFAVYAAGADIERATSLAERIAVALEEPFDLGSASVTIGASVGVALTPDHATDVSGLLRKADIAMYDAKTRRTRFSMYRDELDQHDTGRLVLLTDLRLAIRDNTLDVHYQPQISLATGRVHGVEALARWDHPTRGRVGPDVFIELAEQAGVIEALTRQIMLKALHQVAEWNSEGWDLAVSVNVSAQSLLDERLGSMVEQQLSASGLDPTHLVLEITESTMMTDPVQTRRVIGTLGRLGIELSVDDFGTGFSSLVNLRNLAVNELKIDRSFVAEMLEKHDDDVIVRSTIDLGHNLGLRVVAEGVESTTVLDRLRDLGCDLAQGYAISRPLPATQFRTWLSERAPAPHSRTTEPRPIETRLDADPRKVRSGAAPATNNGSSGRSR